jgi:cob(I)alamin adenosyltransferase
VVREAPHEELDLLKIVEVERMAQEGIEPLSEVLHRGSEREPAKLRQTRVVYRRAKLEMAQLLETLPRRHPLALLEGVVPSLGRPRRWYEASHVRSKASVL